MKILRKKLPPNQEIIQVLSVIVFINFSWSIGRMFWFLPAWRLFLSVADLLPMLAYILSVALLESVLMLGLLLFIALLLPDKLLKNKFVAQGNVMVLLFTTATFLLQLNLDFLAKLSSRQIALLSPTILIAGVALAVLVSYLLVHFINFIDKLMLAFSERMQIFLYVYFPLGLLGFLIVIIRNIT